VGVADIDTNFVIICRSSGENSDGFMTAAAARSIQHARLLARRALGALHTT